MPNFPRLQRHFVGPVFKGYRTRITSVKMFLNGVAYQISLHVRLYEPELRNNPVIDHLKSWTLLFESLIEFLKDDPQLVTSYKSQIRAVIDSPNLESAINISLLYIYDENCARILTERMAQCIQSAEKGLLGSDLSLIYVGIYNPIEGDGKNCLVPLNEQGRRVKRSIFCVPFGNMCFARCICIMEQKHKRGIPIRSWLEGRLRKKMEIISTWMHSVITQGEIERPVNINDFPRAEQLIQMRICVVSAQAGNNFVYRGKENLTRKGTIYLYHSENHFDIITNIKGLMPGTYFCDHCLVSFQIPGSHQCARFCSLCNRQNCLKEKNYHKKCPDCNFLFNTSENCFQFHKKRKPLRAGRRPPSLCHNRWKCDTCDKVITSRNPRAKDKHKCFQKFCHYCLRYQDTMHVCYHRSYVPKKSCQKFIFLDYECDIISTIKECEQGFVPAHENGPDPECVTCQSYQARCNSCSLCQNCFKRGCGQKVHVPNFCVTQKTCDLCHMELNILVKCSGCGNRCPRCMSRDKNGLFVRKEICGVGDCGNREKVFSGENVSEDVGNFIFQKIHSGFKVFAHNMSRYDGSFLMNHCLHNGIIPKNVIYRGTKCIMWSVPRLNIKIMDTLNFLPMKLDEMPKCLGIDMEPKKFFPIWFNDNRHRLYVGPFPDKEYFNLEAMTTAKKLEFEQWYSAKSGDLFNLQQTLYEYCSHDVTLLRVCALEYQNIVKKITCTSIKAVNSVTRKVEEIEIPGFDPYINAITLPSMCQQIFRFYFLEEELKILEISNPEKWIRAVKKAGEIFSIQQNEEGHCEEILLYHPKDTVLKTYFVQSKIGQLNAGGNLTAVKFSRISIMCLKYLEEKLQENSQLHDIKIQHALSPSGEKKIMVGKHRTISVDGYYEYKGKAFVIEFHGCFYHSCPKCFSSNRDKDRHPFFGLTLNENYSLTIKRDQEIRDAGYQLTVVWECDFRLFLTRNKTISTELESLDVSERMNPRDALFGGRCEAFVLYCKPEKSKFLEPDTFLDLYDFVSLYPSVQHSYAFPIGNYQVITQNFSTIHEYFGVAKVRILPPRKLLIPVLPLRIGERLVFCLCHKCAASQQQKLCSCSRKERSWVGTYTTVELIESLKYGYKIEKIFEVYHYPRKEKYEKGVTNGLFSAYIQLFLKQKAEASGWPDYCQDQDSKNAFVQEYKERYGVNLDPAQINYNKGKRTVSKFCLNTLWGLYCQNPNPQVTTICGESEVTKLFELMNSKTKKVTNFAIVNRHVLNVEWVYRQEYAPPNCRRNVILGLFVTSYARIKLNQVLQKNPEQVLYCDTDSVLRINPAGLAQRTNSSILGELADEMKPGIKITEFVSTGSKSYCYATSDGNCVIKAKGFFMTPTLHEKINLKSMLELLNEEISDRRSGAIEDQKNPDQREKNCVYVHRDRIKRNKRLQEITTETEYKRFSCIYTKRILLPDYTTLPYGWN